MKSIATVIIEDEISAVTMLSVMLAEIPHIELVGTASSVAAGIELINSCKVDLVLLDINLGDGTGFSFLENFPNRDWEVIFTTAYDQYAIEAIRKDAIDYLLKPINPVQLQNAIAKVTSKISENVLDDVLRNIGAHNRTTNRKIIFRTQEGLRIVALQDIIRIEGAGSYCQVYTDDGKSFIISGHLKSIEGQLDDTLFHRTHQSHLINLNFVSKLLNEDGGVVELSDSAKVPLSRRNRTEFIQALHDFVGN